MGAVQHAEQIDAQHIVIIWKGYILKFSLYQQTGVIDQYVDAAERVGHLIDHGFDRIVRSDIGLNHQTFLPHGFDLFSHLAGVEFAMMIVDGNMSPFPCECQADGATKPPAAPRDQGDLIFQPSHNLSFLSKDRNRHDRYSSTANVQPNANSCQILCTFCLYRLCPYCIGIIRAQQPWIRPKRTSLERWTATPVKLIFDSHAILWHRISYLS